MPHSRSEFGRFAVDLRADRGILLRDFADMLGVSSAFISNVEFGRKPIPPGWELEISHQLDLSLQERERLRRSILRSTQTFRIVPENEAQQEVLVAFVENRHRITSQMAAAATRLMRSEHGALKDDNEE